MNDRSLDRLFDRFRRHGDVHALGEVFDGTAPELLRVAASLVRDPNEADDLLQQTFLVAIERADRYDSARRLVPWLLGILVRCAREQRRERVRPIEPARLDHPAPLPPDTHAVSGELERELERALGALPSDDRALLDAYLRADTSPAELARERGLAPGATRMRIHRGLDRLRRLLPAGLALGGAAGVLRGDGLPSVRASVLRAAAARPVAPGGAGGAGTAASLLLGKKLALVLAVVAAAGVWLTLARTERVESGATPEIAHASAPVSDGAAPGLAPVSPGGDVPPVSEPTRETRVPVLAVDADHAGIRGRVVEHDGVPVAGLRVELVEIDDSMLFPPLFAALDGEPLPRLLAASAVTDAEGRFVLAGLTARAFHALGVDLGGERATLRILEASLAPGATVELGDVVLSATGAVSGRVVDGARRPVAGARVRVGPIPAVLLALGFQRVGAGGAVGALKQDGTPDFFLELPAWLAALEQKLPLATTVTDADGRFAFERVTAGSLTALVDAAGHAPLSSPALDVRAGARADLGELVVAAGTSARGRVLDAAGRPVPLAELRGGTEAEGIVVLGPIHAADGEGRFVIEHLPDDLPPVVLARRDGRGPWVAACEQQGELVATLAAEQTLVVEVVDAAGAPIATPRFYSRPTVPPGREVASFNPFTPAPQALDATAVDGQPGRWRLRPVASGWILLAVRADGFARAATALRIGDDDPPVERLVLARLRRTEVLVRAADRGAPLAGALVRVEQGPTATLASARTDAEGRAVLQLPDAANGLWLHAEHPRFAPAGRPLPSGAALEIELTAGARLVARIADPFLAERHYLLQLQHSGSADRDELHLPRMHAVSGEGALELEHLPPGNWSWSLFESIAGEDLLGLFDVQRQPQSLASGKVVLVEGETFELALGDARPTPLPSRGATLSGTVSVEGRLAGALMIRLVPAGDHGSEGFHTDGRAGRFRFEEVPPGTYFLVVEGPSKSGFDQRVTLVQEEIELAEGDAREVAFDVANLPLSVRVLSAEGRPLRGAEVAVFRVEPGRTSFGSEATTDAHGVAELALPASGSHHVLVTHATEGIAQGDLTVSVDDENEVTITLSRGVECAGSLRLDRPASASSDEGFLFVNAENSGWPRASCVIELDGATAEFRLVGLEAGKYQAVLYGDGRMLQGSFELPEWGNGALELEFVSDR